MIGQGDDIVVTGLGLLSAVGDTVEECWEAIQAGQCGIRPATVVPTDRGIKVAGQLTGKFADDEPVDAPPRGARAPLDRCHEIAQRGAKEALDASGILAGDNYDRNRIGIVLGTSLGGQRLGEKFHRQWVENGLDQADGLLLLDYPISAVLDNLARDFDLRGPRCVQSNACAAGAVAIAFAMELIKGGEVDAVLTGGVDPLAYLSFGGFQTLGALDEQPCSPYTRSKGTSLGEGGGFLVLERREAAQARGAEPIAVAAGYGLSADAYHATAPDPKGVGAKVAMAAALEMAGLQPQDVDYINGHGTGTPANDSTEPKAIKALFKPTPPPVSSTKSMVGHTLGAAGAVEAVVSVLAIRDQVMPPTVVPEGVETTTGLDIVPGTARQAKVSAVVSNSFAFGGNNASLALVSADHPSLSERRPEPELRKVVITGAGAIAGTAQDVEELAAAFAQGQELYGDATADLEGYGTFPKAQVPEEHLRKGINPRYFRKMDNLERQAAVAVAQLAKAHKPSRTEAAGTGVICATTGPVQSIETFEKSLIRRGTGSAAVFPNTVMNAAAGYVALLNAFRGPTATHYGGGPASISALYLAHRLIATGQSDRIIVLSTDEVPDSHLAGYAWLPGYLSKDKCVPGGGSGRLLGGAAVAVLLEAQETATSTVLGSVEGFGMTGGTCGGGRIDADGEPWERSFRLAMEHAGVEASELSLFVSDGCGVPGIDDVEAAARGRVGLGETESFAPKQFVGDTRASAPLLGLVHGLTAETTRDGKSFLVSCCDTGGLYGSIVVRTAGG